MAQSALSSQPAPGLTSAVSSRVAVALLAAISLGVFVLLVAMQMWRPFLYDDVNFAFAADAVARTGIPFANAGYMSDRWDFSQREQWALWHPPLYLYSLGLAFKLFGTSELVARTFGSVCIVLAGGLVALVGRRIAAPGAEAATAVIAFALFILNPLTIQSALILDIDGTVLLTLVCALVALYIQHVHAPRSWTLPALAVLFAVALWAKMTTPLGLLVAIVVYRVLDRKPRLGLREALVIGGVGAGLFLATYTLMTTLLHMPWGMPFAVLWVEFTDASESTKGWRESFGAFLAAVSPSAYWLSPTFLILAVAAMVTRGRELLLTRRGRTVDIILVMAVGVYAIYLIKLAGLFPKYHISAVPFLALAAAWLVGRAVSPVRRLDLLAWGISVALCVWYFRGVTVDWYRESFGPLGTLFLERPLFLALACVGVSFLVAGGSVSRHIAAVLLALVIGWSVGMGWRQARADFSTNYWYGTQGQRDAAAMLDSLVGPDEFWGGAKEVAFYARNQNYIDEDTLQYWMENRGGLTQEPIAGHQPRVLAVWTGHSYVYWLFHTAVEMDFQPVAEIGTYTILVRRS